MVSPFHRHGPIHRYAPVIRTSVIGLLSLFVLVGADARADEAVERPATWDMSVEQLQAIGLGQYRGDPVPVPNDAPLERAPDDPVFAKQGVIFVNFDGASLSSGYDNSKTNTTQIGQLAGSFAAYGDGAKRDAVLQAVQTDWSPYNVIVTQNRPGSGDYTMNMTGPTNPFGGGVLGIAPLDCNDSQTHNNITYAFHSVNDSFSAAVTATTIGQEVAHSFGLEHVDEPGDIMNPYNAGGDAAFTDQCIPIVQGGQCGSQHAAQCGSAGMQNSHQELMNLFGPSEPDTQAPAVEITAPSDGDTFETGANFEIVVTANDDTGIQELILFNNGMEAGTDTSEPFGWGVENIPEGSYEFYVEARDLAGNVTMSNIVNIGVGGAPPPNGDSGGDSAGDSGGDSGGVDSGGDGTSGGGSGGTGGGSGPGDDSGGLPPGFGQSGSDVDSCACRTRVGDRGQPYAWALGMLGLLLLRRRH